VRTAAESTRRTRIDAEKTNRSLRDPDRRERPSSRRGALRQNCSFLEQIPEELVVDFVMELDTCALTNVPRAREVQFHHEVYNQFLWNLF
jgi:hypothetical protein